MSVLHPVANTSSCTVAKYWCVSRICSGINSRMFRPTWNDPIALLVISAGIDHIGLIVTVVIMPV